MAAFLQSVVVTALLGALQAGGGELDALLDRWQKQFSELHSFTCRFKQEKKVSFMRRPLVSSGSLKYLDRKILWVTDAPSASFLSFDGREARIYHPEFNSLEIYALGGSGPGGAGGSASGFMKGGFPGFTGDFSALRQQYAIEALPVDAGSKDHRLRMTPKDEALKKEVVAIEFLLDEALGIKEWKLTRANGDELKLTISDFVPNAKVEPKDLQFEVPAGVKVVRMGADEKPAAPAGQSGNGKR